MFQRHLIGSDNMQNVIRFSFEKFKELHGSKDWFELDEDWAHEIDGEKIYITYSNGVPVRAETESEGYDMLPYLDSCIENIEETRWDKD